MSGPDDQALRAAIIRIARAMDEAGFAPSKSGNVSHRFEDGFLITPSALPYGETEPDDLVRMSLDGRALQGTRPPSSEWRFHAAIYRARPEVAAIVHTHSPRAAALSAARRGVPAFHYMVAIGGGADIRCADYATFGTEELARAAVAGLESRKAVLLANHGVIATGGTIDAAWALAREVENLAGQYLDILAAGLEPILLDAAEMTRVAAQFAAHGRKI